MNLRSSIAALPGKGAYVNAWKVLNELPDHAPVTLDWTGSKPAAQVRRDFRKALDARINARGGQEWRNQPIDIGLIRDAYRLDDIKQRRVRVYQFESELCRRRFGHLLARHDD
jgi:hypothetical protein